MLIVKARTSKGNVPVDVKTFTFPGGELQVTAEIVALRSDVEQIDMVAHLASAHDIMELLLATDAIRRQVSAPIRLFMPYVPYGRQDRVANEGEALSIKVFADLINAQHYELVVITDPHSDVTPALLERAQVLSPINRIVQIPNISQMTLVCPDAGARKRVHDLAKRLRLDVIHADKIRNTKTGEITGTVVDLRPIGPQQHSMPLLVVDDICDGGRTFIELAKALRGEYYAGPLYLYVTHGIFSNGVESLLACYERIYTARDWTQSHHPLVTEII